MARHKESKDTIRRERLSRAELELWPLYSDIQFEPWVQDIIDRQPEEDEIERPDVIKEKDLNAHNFTGRKGKGEIVIDGIAYPNAFQASKCLGVSNSMIYKWLRSGVAKRVEEELVAEPSSIEPSSIEPSSIEPPIVINGRYFKSIDAAAKRLGVDKSVIIKWLELNI